MSLESIREYLPILIPIIVIQFTLTIAAIIHIVRHENYKFGNRTMWILVSFIQTVGPLVYFFFGRGEE